MGFNLGFKGLKVLHCLPSSLTIYMFWTKFTKMASVWSFYRNGLLMVVMLPYAELP